MAKICPFRIGSLDNKRIVAPNAQFNDKEAGCLGPACMAFIATGPAKDGAQPGACGLALAPVVTSEFNSMVTPLVLALKNALVDPKQSAPADGTKTVQ